jgi:hypothetical protein
MTRISKRLVVIVPMAVVRTKRHQYKLDYKQEWIAQVGEMVKMKINLEYNDMLSRVLLATTYPMVL